MHFPFYTDGMIHGQPSRGQAINRIRTFGITAVLLLGAGPAFSQGIEWETLNQEVMDLYRAGKYDRAVVVAKKALEVAETNVGPDHPSVTTSLNNLAALYKTQGQYAQAEPLYERAMAIYEKALGSDHPDVATSLENMAQLFRATNRSDEAEPLEQRAARIRAIQR